MNIGPVNLVAIEEYEEQAERKEYLDAQHADLVEALETWDEWSDRQVAAITRSLNWLEERYQTLNQTSDIGTISVACALDYLDFRFADLDWRRHHEGLNEWLEQFAQRESIRATAPVES